MISFSVKSIDHNGAEIWHINGNILHRDGDLPAYISANGKSRSWHRNGVTHRENDKPAFVSPVTEQWCINGDIHRTNGPAVIYLNRENDNRWYIKHKHIRSASEFQSLTGNSDEKMAELLLKYGPIA